ncbi:GPALPP motifs-containing protein 1 [Sporobolomyces koalae]|uniref:GPALPP motifs-containing protein 1 n=1 Tax=Sporobolomyces koalae TaxID=500713 RepID=UPI00317558F9
MAIGPEIPAHLLNSTSSTTEPELPAPVPSTEDDSDSDYAPDLPPELLEARQQQQASGGANLNKVVAGPQLPPHLASRSSATDHYAPTTSSRLEQNEEGSDEDYGPGPLPPPAGFGAGSNHDDNEGARAFLEREERQKERERQERELANAKPKREEWMLVPPKEMDLMSSIDTTKLKSRGFQTGPKAQQSNRASSSNEPNLWTETPQERQQRLQDEALGKKRKAENSHSGPTEEETEEQMRKRVRDRKLKEQVERHNEKSRKHSLLDAHASGSSKSKSSKKNEAGPEEPTGWDRERDMSIGGRLMDDGKRKQMIKDAKGLGGRFGSSGFM